MSFSIGDDEIKSPQVLGKVFLDLICAFERYIVPWWNSVRTYFPGDGGTYRSDPSSDLVIHTHVSKIGTLTLLSVILIKATLLGEYLQEYIIYMGIPSLD